MKTNLRNAERTERALQKAIYSVVKRYGKIPNDENHAAIQEIVWIIDKIINHAKRLGWIEEEEVPWEDLNLVEEKPIKRGTVTLTPLDKDWEDQENYNLDFVEEDEPYE